MDGMESEFSRELERLIAEHGKDALDAIDGMVSRKQANNEVLSEALRWVGLMDHDETRERRRHFAQRYLSSDSAMVRDGAALALSFMDDPRSLPSLKKAIDHEKVPELRGDMQQVLDQLEETRRCRNS